MQYGGWYKSIYGMPMEHRPDDDIIDDDSRLDSWYETFMRDAARRAGKKGDPRYSFVGDGGFTLPEFGM